MGGTDGAAGFRAGGGGISERGYGDPLCDSRERSGDAELGGKEHVGSNAFALVGQTGDQDFGSRVQQFAAGRSGAAKSASGRNDEGRTGRACGGEFGGADDFDSGVGG